MGEFLFDSTGEREHRSGVMGIPNPGGLSLPHPLHSTYLWACLHFYLMTLTDWPSFVAWVSSCLIVLVTEDIDQASWVPPPRWSDTPPTSPIYIPIGLFAFLSDDWLAIHCCMGEFLFDSSGGGGHRCHGYPHPSGLTLPQPLHSTYLWACLHFYLMTLTDWPSFAAWVSSYLIVLVNADIDQVSWVPPPRWSDTPPTSPIYIPIGLFTFLSDAIGWLAAVVAWVSSCLIVLVTEDIDQASWVPPPRWSDTPPPSPIYIPIGLFTFLSDAIGWLAAVVAWVSSCLIVLVTEDIDQASWVPPPRWSDTPPPSPLYIPIGLFTFLSDAIGWLAAVVAWVSSCLIVLVTEDIDQASWVPPP